MLLLSAPARPGCTPLRPSSSRQPRSTRRARSASTCSTGCPPPTAWSATGSPRTTRRSSRSPNTCGVCSSTPTCGSSAGCGSAARSPARTCLPATTRWCTRPARCGIGGWASRAKTGPDTFTLDAESVAVVGVGNVAVDVARILVRDPDELRRTDVSQPVLEALTASKVREVHMIGRRGPAQAKFTTKELRELGELAGVDIVVGAGEADPNAFDATASGAALAGSDRRVRGNLAVIGDWAARAPSGHARRLTVRFWLRPVKIEGPERVSGLTVERTRLDENGVLTGTGELETIPAQMVLRSVGYQSVPLPGIPFDERTHTVPNAEGRVLGPDGTPLPREYVSGWLKRGPTGVIGTNKSDAAQTVRSLLADLTGGATDGADLGRVPLLDVLAGRDVTVVSYAGWLKVEQAEADLAASLGRGARVKLASREEIDALCFPPD